MRFLLDTNICIYIRQKRPPEVLARFQKLSPDQAAISVITLGELRCGGLKSQQSTLALAKLDELITHLSVLALPASAAMAYGRIRAELSASGELIGANDLWIAAHALAEGLILVTNNEREFKRVEGLKIQNWL